MSRLAEVRGARFQRNHWLLLAAILLLALGLRVPGLTRHSLWGDELLSLECSAGNCLASRELPRDSVIERPPRLTWLSGISPVPIWASVENDLQPPLYYLVLGWWRAAFGPGDRAARGVSVLLSLVAIALLFDLGRILFRPGVGGWAAILMAVAHPQIWYAQEARPYALLEVMVLGVAVALVRIERLGYRLGRALALGICLVGAMLTHYFAIAGCLAAGLYALARLRGNTRLRVIGVMGISAAGYLLLWGAPFLRQMSTATVGEVVWLQDAEPGFPSRWLGRVLLAPMSLFARVMPGDGYAPELLGMLLLLPVLLIRRRPALLLPALGAVGLLALPAVTDLIWGTRQLEYERYFLAAAPFVYLLAAAALADHRKRWVRSLFPAVLTLFCLITIPSRLHSREKDDWRSVARTVASTVPPGDFLAIRMRWRYMGGLAYLAIDHYGPPALPKIVLLTHPANSELQTRLAGVSRLWLVTWEPSEAPALLPGFQPVSVNEAGKLGVLVQMRRSGLTGPGGSP